MIVFLWSAPLTHPLAWAPALQAVEARRAVKAMTSTMSRPREWNKSTHTSERKGPIKPPAGRGAAAAAAAASEGGTDAGGGGGGAGAGGGQGAGIEGGAARARAARPWCGPGMQFDKPELPCGWNRSEQIDRNEVDALLLSQTQRALSHTRGTLLRKQYISPMQAEQAFMETLRAEKAVAREAAAVPPELAPAQQWRETSARVGVRETKARRRASPAARRAGTQAALEVRYLDDWEPLSNGSPAPGGGVREEAKFLGSDGDISGAESPGRV